MREKDSVVVLGKKQQRYLSFCDQLTACGRPSRGGRAGKAKGQSPGRESVYEKLHPLVEELLSTLDSTEARVLRARYGIDRGYPSPLHKIAKRLGLSPAEVLRLEENALAKLQFTLMERQSEERKSYRWN